MQVSLTFFGSYWQWQVISKQVYIQHFAMFLMLEGKIPSHTVFLML